MMDPRFQPLRYANIADLPRMWAIRTVAVRVTCASHYPANIIDTLSASPPPASMPALIEAGGALVAEEGNKLVGYAILDTGSGEVDALFVDPRLQGRGIARRLLSALETMAAEHDIARLFLSSSLNAVGFYQRAGFSAVRDELYPHRSGIGIPAVFMQKVLQRD